MPFGAHETMEVHEILNEKMNLINHFSLYAQMTQNGQIRGMLDRHIATAMQAYEQLAGYTHDYSAANAPQPAAQRTMAGTQPQQIQYGLRQPAPITPGIQGQALNDMQIMSAMLCCHKNSAKNHMNASLECADPNVRQMLLHGANLCAEQAYEVFTVMNQQGIYQVPTMNDHTAKTYLHTYQMPNQH